ncbi:MAG: DUF5700 domain-containing putative Zn-dependent protease [Bacteroidota bacterium]|nr:DUF5700 domain-containing putative Zn-dependent protease [Bacteroidota bacterium]
MSKQNRFFQAILILVSPLILYTSCTEELSTIIDDYGSYGSTVLKDTSVDINPGSDAVEVSFDLVDIKIPKGAVPDGTELVIARLDESKEENMDEYDYGPVYEITLEEHTTFSDDIIISLSYTNDQIPEKFKLSPFPAYYSEDRQRWERFDIYQIDTVTNQVVIFTKHLTKLCWFSPKKISGYTDYYPGRFTIYYKESDIKSNSAYNSPRSSYYTFANYPHYIEDIAYYINCAFRRYQSQFPEWKDSHFNVFIKPLGKNGYVSVCNSINLDTDMDHNTLRSTCAHELLHVVQDTYYVKLANIFSSTSWLWWAEATAVNADRLVFTGLLDEEYESLFYTNNTLPDNLAKSWDDCPTGPNFYAAGGFVSWLHSYRDHYKTVAMNELLIHVGTNDHFSTIRTSVNNFIETKLGTSIGEEYRDYIKWAYEGKHSVYQTWESAIKLASSHVPASDQGWQKKLQLNNDYPTYTEQQTIPNIGVRCYKIMNYFTPSESVSLEIKDMGQDVEAYVYRVDNFGKNNEKKEFLKKLEVGVQETLKVEGLEQCLDVMCFNKHVDDDQLVNLEVSTLLGISGFKIFLEVNGASSGYTRFEREILPDPFNRNWISLDVGSFTLSGIYGNKNCSLEIVFNTDGKSLKSFKLKEDNSHVSGAISTEINLHDVPLEWNFSGSLQCDLYNDELCSIISLFRQTSDNGTISGCKSGHLVLELK